MTDTIPYYNTDISSQDTLYKVHLNSVKPHANNTDKSMEFWRWVMTIHITTTSGHTLLLSSSTQMCYYELQFLK
jgi:hypothetical protein